MFCCCARQHNPENHAKKEINAHKTSPIASFTAQGLQQTDEQAKMEVVSKEQK